MLLWRFIPFFGGSASPVSRLKRFQTLEGDRAGRDEQGRRGGQESDLAANGKNFPRQVANENLKESSTT